MTDGLVLVVGAGGALGLEIVNALRASGRAVIGAYRTVRPGAVEAIKGAGGDPLKLDLEDASALREALTKADAAIFTPILTNSAPAARLLPPGQPAVFFSSNNVAIDPQAEVYARLLQKEAEVKAAAPQAVILRPTMIYGYPGDGNLARLMASMRRSLATPIPAAAKALQQPVYFRDLARIAVRALDDGTLSGETRAAAGPASVTIAALYAAAKQASGAKTLLVPVPTGFVAKAAETVEKAGLKLPVSAAQLSRAGRDKLPQGPVILGETPLTEGLKALAETLPRP
jgi:nucleoside-diphosphate-sugar epimerase